MIIAPRWRSQALRDVSFLPPHIPGCQLWCETDTSRHLVGGVSTAVVFPADPLVDGNMEAAGVGAWLKFPAATTTLTKEAAVPYQGAQWLKVDDAAGAATYETYQNVLVVGNTYRIQGAALSDGVSIPRLYVGGNTPWTGVAGAGWQPFDVTSVAAANTEMGFLASAGAVPSWCGWDAVTITPRNASQLTDLTGLGHHLAQATATSHPLWVPSGVGGLLRGDGVNDVLRAAFALVQPAYYCVWTKWTALVNQRLIDGVTGSAQYVAGDATHYYAYAGAYNVYQAMSAASWQMLEGYLAGAAGWAAVNAGAKTTGDTGGNNPGGISLFGNLAGTAWSTADVIGVAVFNRMPTDAERTRLYRYGLRLQQRLAL